MSDDSWRHGDAIFLIAGEPSGDALGAKLIAALKRAGGGRFQFLGVGGERMAAEGLVRLFPLTDIAGMGFTAGVPRLPLLLQRTRAAPRPLWGAAPAAGGPVAAPSFCPPGARRARD